MSGSELPMLPSYDAQSLLNAQPVMVAVIDPATYAIQFQNETGLQKLGDLSGRSCYEAIAGCPAPCAFCKMPQALSTGEVTVNEVCLPNKQHLLVQWSKAATHDGRTHIIETITDVTEHKRLEEAAQKAEKMEALSRLAGGMAHDINNLLTVILCASEHIAHGLKSSTSTVDPVGQIQGAVDRAAELTRRLVAFSHHQMVQPCQLDLNVALDELNPQIRSLVRKGVSLQMALDSKPAPVLVDRQQIEHIVTVLVSNARDAMPNGGCLTLSTSAATVQEELAREHAVKPGPYVHLIVRDTGCGIAPEVQAHLFEPFFIRKGEETGRGLGLPSVYGMVRQNGGFITVKSDRNAGTEFTVALPRSELVQQAWVPPSAVSVSGGGETILLVEDDEDVRMAVSDMLKIAGYTVQEACDGMDALQRLETMASPPSLVLTDVMMPRMTGPQLAKQIYSIMPAVSILYMSGYTDRILEPVGDRPLAFIRKPFTAKELTRKVSESMKA
ncbi:MAG TPA: ATP-binding protein [Nitrospira sp.]|nr:ATP-binding protein [Nitrospira sp.]